MIFHLVCGRKRSGRKRESRWVVNAVGSMVEMREMTFGIFGKGAGEIVGK